MIKRQWKEDRNKKKMKMIKIQIKKEVDIFRAILKNYDNSKF